MELYTTDSDREFYQSTIRPLLPAKILDFHTHLWQADHWLGTETGSASSGLDSASVTGVAASKYMSTHIDYGVEKMQECVAQIFPDLEYHAVVFGQPTPTADNDRTNAYASDAAEIGNYYPLMIPLPGKRAAGELREDVAAGGFYGFKVFLNWTGNDYADVAVEDMITDVEMSVANDLGLVVLLHVPGALRLAANGVQESIKKYSMSYPNAKIVLAHCGRCYDQDSMAKSMRFLKGLDNVYMDSSMVMDPGVIKMVFDAIGPGRLLFGTDFPVAVMKGRRVHVMDHWVDIVAKGYPASEYRVPSDNMSATYMAYEIILAIIRGARLAGLSKAEAAGVFFKNGIELIRNTAS